MPPAWGVHNGLQEFSTCEQGDSEVLIGVIGMCLKGFEMLSLLLSDGMNKFRAYQATIYHD